MALPTASDNPFPSFLATETAAASISTPASGKQRLFVDTDHVLKYKNSSGTVTNVGTASVLGRAALSRAQAVAGNITLNSTAAYAEVAAATGGPGSGGLDLTIAAATNDVLDVSAMLSCPATTAVDVWFDIATIVSAAAVNWLGQSAGSNANNGLCYLPSGEAGTRTISIQYTVQSGDITGGNVVLRLYYLSGAAVNRLLARLVVSGPLQFSVVNLSH